MKNTRKAFWFLLAHVGYVALFAVCGAMANLLESPCNREGLYMVFAVPAALLLFAYPLAGTIINIASLRAQIYALRHKESKVKNFVMMAFVILIEVFLVFLTIKFFQGAANF